MSKGSGIRRTIWPKTVSRPLVSPIQPSVVYSSDSPNALDAQYEGEAAGYTYAREGHPNADVLAQKIDRLESASGGLITGSGMAAVTAVMMGLLKAGDHVLAGNQLYGRSLRMLQEELPRFGVQTSLADPTDATMFLEQLRPETRIILLEVVSNPTLRVADLSGIAKAANARGILLVIDNTFTTPRAIRPFEHGADIVLHSVTKLLAGHSDATLGYVSARDPEIRKSIYDTAVTLGLTPSPFDCWLAERGMQSFVLRYDRAEENAARIADALAGLTGVRRVLYPGRDDHPDHARAHELLGSSYGNMVSFEIEGGRGAAERFVRAIPQMPFAPTLGDIGTTLSHPASSSHRALGADGRAALGISEGFFRLSVGVEDTEMLIEELGQAVHAAS